jgi:hypothetical protein
MTSHLLLDIPAAAPALLPRLQARYTRDWFLLGNADLALARAVTLALSQLAAEPPPDREPPQ